MNEPATVSVIIPTYNCALYLEQALCSVLAQQHPALEIVVVDDGSTDDTPAIASKFQKDIRCFRLSHCGLPAVVRNYGIAQASGEYVAFLDADDWWSPEKLEQQVEIMLADDIVGIVGTDLQLVDEKGHPLPDTPVLEHQHAHLASLEQDPWLAMMHFGNLLNTSSVLVRRLLLDRASGFPTAAGLRRGQDWALWGCLTFYTRVRVIREKLTFYRVHAASLTSEAMSDRISNARRLAAIDFWRSKLLEDMSSAPHKRRVAMAKILTHGAKLHLQDRRWSAAAEYMRDALVAAPASPSTWGRVVLAIGRGLWAPTVHS